MVHDIKEYIWNCAMYELGIPKSSWCTPGVIDKDLTHEEEVDCIEVLLDGLVTSSGYYAEYYNKWMFSHAWSKQTMYNKKQGLYTYTLINYEDDLERYKNLAIEKMEELGIEPIFVSGCKVYGVKDCNSTVMPIGQFSVLQTEENEYWGSDRNTLEGYTGEAYQVEYLNKEGIIFVGCPIELYITDKEVGYFIDLEQTEINSYKTWFEVVGAVLDFEEGSYSVVNSKNIVTSIFNLYHNAKLGEIIGVITNKLSESVLESAKVSVYPYIRGKND